MRKKRVNGMFTENCVRRSHRDVIKAGCGSHLRGEIRQASERLRISRGHEIQTKAKSKEEGRVERKVVHSPVKRGSGGCLGGSWGETSEIPNT
jgi:hypothetical protein